MYFLMHGTSNQLEYFISYMVQCIYINAHICNDKVRQSRQSALAILDTRHAS